MFFLSFTAEKMKSTGSNTASNEDDFLTPEQKVQDKWVKERLGQTLKDFDSEMQANHARGKETS